MQVPPLTGPRVYPQTLKNTGASPRKIPQAATPELQFSGGLNNQEILGWVEQIQAQVQRGPLYLISAGKGKKDNEFAFDFQFYGEETAYKLTLFLDRQHDEIIASVLKKTEGTPEGQQWPSMLLFAPGIKHGLHIVHEVKETTVKISNQLVSLSMNDELNNDVSSENKTTLQQAFHLENRLIRDLQRAQLYTSKEKAASEYNQIQARYKLALEDFQLDLITGEEKDAAEARHEKETAVWLESLKPIVRQERIPLREVREQVEELAASQIRDHARTSNGTSLWQRLWPQANSTVLQFTPLT